MPDPLLAAFPQHPWLSSASGVASNWDAVAHVCVNAEDILEPEDFEGDHRWFLADVPIQWEAPSPSKLETRDEWEERLTSLRSMPTDEIPPIIIFMDEAGALKIVDGYHRLALGLERGQTEMRALIRTVPWPEWNHDAADAPWIVARATPTMEETPENTITMIPSPALPSYFSFKEADELDPARLSNGSYQQEALDFFASVVDMYRPTDFADTYHDILIMHEQQGTVSVHDFLSMTVALAASKDIAPLAPHMANDNLPLGLVSSKMKKLQSLIEIDISHQYASAGDLSLKLFAMMYNLNTTSLAEKIAVDDHQQAFSRLSKQDSAIALRALARLPYNPLSVIRSNLVAEAPISQEELSIRFKHQVTALYSAEHTKLINPSQGYKLHPNSQAEYTTYDVIDHGVRLLPGYLELLGDPKSDALQNFGFLSRMQPAISAEQQTLLTNLLNDFETAGVSRSDILVLGILNPNDVLKLDIEVPEEINKWDKVKSVIESYKSMSFEEKQNLYLQALINAAATFTEDPSEHQAQAKLRQVQHLMRKEPMALLESLCTTDQHWTALYRMTANKRYLEKLDGHLEQVLSADLGL
jgi:hypothetical protein